MQIRVGLWIVLAMFGLSGCPTTGEDYALSVVQDGKDIHVELLLEGKLAKDNLASKDATVAYT